MTPAETHARPLAGARQELPNVAEAAGADSQDVSADFGNQRIFLVNSVGTQFAKGRPASRQGFPSVVRPAAATGMEN